MDPRTTLLKWVDSFENGVNCGRIRFEKELNMISMAIQCYFTAQHIWCFTAWINEVNFSTFYSPWIYFYTNIISLGFLELFDSRRHLDKARSEQTGILMLSPQIHNDSLRPITGWLGAYCSKEAFGVKFDIWRVHVFRYVHLVFFLKLFLLNKITKKRNGTFFVSL